MKPLKVLLVPATTATNDSETKANTTSVNLYGSLKWLSANIPILCNIKYAIGTEMVMVLAYPSMYF